jgi:hypothetical protein
MYIKSIITLLIKFIESKYKLNDHRLKAVGFLAAESRFGAKAP